MNFQCGLKHAAFLCVSRAFEEFRPRIFEVRTTHATKLWKFPEKVWKRQRRELILPTGRETVLVNEQRAAKLLMPANNVA